MAILGMVADRGGPPKFEQNQPLAPEVPKIVGAGASKGYEPEFQVFDHALTKENAGAAATASGVEFVLKARRFLVGHSIYDLASASGVQSHG